jgi:hypothetical protein
MATLRKYSETVSPSALALARIFTASDFFTTNRTISSRFWLAGISGLPARLTIAPSFWY